MHRLLQLERLETHLAPATLVDASRVTFLDSDGDTVTVALSKPVLNTTNVNSVFNFDGGSVDGDNSTAQKLQELNLTSFQNGLSVSLTGTGGDGMANVHWINAQNIDLASVSVSGDLGRVSAGNAIPITPGLAALTAGSIGVRAKADGLNFFDVQTYVVGSIGNAIIDGDVVGGSVVVEGGLAAGIGSIEIGGNLSDEPSMFGGGLISATGRIGTIHVHGDIIGALAPFTGIQAGSSIKSVVVDGSIRGGNSEKSASIVAGKTIYAVFVGGSVEGGGGKASASITSQFGTIRRVQITGDLKGGVGERSAMIAAGTGYPATGAHVGTISIGGSILGGSGPESASIVAYAGNLGPITVAGSVQGGDGNSSASFTTLGDAHGGAGRLVSIKVSGDVIGQGPNSASFTASTIGSIQLGSLKGGVGENSASVLSIIGAINSIKIDGDLTGGAGRGSGFIMSQAPIRSVDIGGSLIGGAELETGSITAESLVSISIGGDVKAGTVDGSGTIGTYEGGIASITIAGDLIGGSADYAASINSAGRIGPVSLRSMIGGAGRESASIRSALSIASLTLSGSMLGNVGVDSASIKSDGGFIGPITIAGSVIGGDGDHSASFNSYTSETEPRGRIVSISIDGSLQGGFGILSGGMDVARNIGPVNLGALKGGEGFHSGLIDADSISRLHITGDIEGGIGYRSGHVHLRKNLGPLTVDGSIKGGGGELSGGLQILGSLGPVHIGHDLVGGSVADSGRINVLGRSIGAINIGGSILGGDGVRSGSIEATAGNIGRVTIAHDVIGGAGQDSASIIAYFAGSGGRIASVTIGGSVTGGAGIGSASLVASLSIGRVIVAEDWIGASIDVGNPGGNQYSSIREINVGGTVNGTAADGDDFHFQAPRIIALKIGGASIPLNPGSFNDDMPLGMYGDFRLIE